MRLNFQEWLPDQPAYQNAGMTTADGVFAIANGYVPALQFQTAPNADLPDRALGGAAYRRGDNVYIFAADATDIYRYQGGFTSLVTGLSSNATIGVSFAPYNALMLASNGVDPIQKFDPTLPTTMADLSAEAPTARYLAVVGGFVIAAYANDDELTIAWSGNGDPTEWTPGTLDAGSVILDSGGPITGAVGGDYAIIFQENRVLRMTPTYDETVWQFDDITRDLGCTIPKSIAPWDKNVFFYSDRGFMMTDGNSVTPIGLEKVDRSFASVISPTYQEYCTAVVDPRNTRYIVLVPSAAPANSAFVYNYSLQKWNTLPLSAELIFPALAESVSLEELDAIYGNLDEIPISLDNAAFKGGTSVFMVFDGDHNMGTLSGATMRATLIDGQKDLVQDRNTRMRWVRPITDASAATVSVRGSNSLDMAPVETVYALRGPQGTYRVRENWNLAQIGVIVPAGSLYTYVQGYDIDAVAGGRL